MLGQIVAPSINNAVGAFYIYGTSMYRSEMLENLSTAHLADGCLRAGVRPRCVGLRPVTPGMRMAGPARVVHHYGSVDIFLETFESASPGDVLVIDNTGRADESCIGDLVTIEAKQAGLAGIVVWGYHRDTAEIRNLGLPVFSLGAISAGPVRLDPRDDAPFGNGTIAGVAVDNSDFVAADDDGVLFLPGASLESIAQAARAIRETELRQAARVQSGISLRSQLRFSEFLEHRRKNPALTFRDHLASIGGAIEVEIP
jgi:4-hydroxy-4-methyl-2-oxoglutarate aldolase